MLELNVVIDADRPSEFPMAADLYSLIAGILQSMTHAELSEARSELPAWSSQTRASQSGSVSRWR